MTGTEYADELEQLKAIIERLLALTREDFWDPDHKRLYDEAMLRRALAPWGRVRLHRHYRSPLRNFLPIRQRGAAVFIFEVTPPSPPGAR